MNVYHLYNKVPDVCNFLKSQSSSEYELFGIAESRLDFQTIDHSISIPDYDIMKRDPQLPGQTGIAVSACASVCPGHYTQTQTWKMTKSAESDGIYRGRSLIILQNLMVYTEGDH